MSPGSGSFTGNIRDNALVTFNRTTPLTYSNVISGSGAVAINSGTVSFRNANNYSGGTTIGAGAALEDGLGGGLAAPGREDWNKPGSIEDLLPTFGSWRFPWLDVPGVIREATQLLEWPMVDRDPLPRWQLGRSTLLGDAAHPMVPIGSNGATQAIMDAQALAEALASGADLHAALAAYENERRPQCARIVEMNRREGLDAILDRVEALRTAYSGATVGDRIGGMRSPSW